MEIEFILGLIEDSGYTGLFLWLWLGVFGIPIPNEVITMTVGFAASVDVLHPYLLFIVTYFGLIAAITTCYFLGKYVGSPILPMLRKSRRLSKGIDKSMFIIERYHAFSLSISYFVPGVRNFVPFIYGMSKLPFKTFALFSYSGVFLWIVVMFSVGYWFGDQKELLYHYAKELFILIGFILFLYIAGRMLKKNKKRKLKIMYKRAE